VVRLPISGPKDVLKLLIVGCQAVCAKVSRTWTPWRAAGEDALGMDVAWRCLEVPTLLLPAVACWSTGNSESRPLGDRGTRTGHSTLQIARKGDID
jgi:hypothetical protein